MTLKSIYYKIRPMAKLHSGEVKLHSEKRLKVHPIVPFFISSFISVIVGFFGGAFLWLSVGFNPDNSGGTFIFILGAILMSFISILVYLVNKNRYIFYGLNFFTILVCLLFVISIII